MPTKKKSKRVQSSSATSAKMRRKVQSNNTVRNYAAMEAQIAELQEQIAALKGLGTRGEGREEVQSSKCKVQSEQNVNTNNNTLNSEPRYSGQTTPGTLNSPRETALLKPDLISVTATGSNTIKVEWWGVPNASGYDVQTALNMAFNADVRTFHFNASVNMAILTGGFEPDIQYYVRIRATGEGEFTNSPWTNNKTVTTLANPDDALVSLLANLQAVFQHFRTVMPELENTVLTTLERRRLNGSGVRRYGFIDKVSDVAAEYPQFWPSLVNGGSGSVDYQTALKEHLRKIETLRNLLVWLRMIERVVADLFLITSHDAFQMANTYYGSVRSAARSNLLGARQIFQLLRAFWNRPRSTSAEPTQRETLRDFKAVLHGRKEGIVSVENESDRVVKGEKILLDETRKKPRGGVKVMEQEEEE